MGDNVLDFLVGGIVTFFVIQLFSTLYQSWQGLLSDDKKADFVTMVLWVGFWAAFIYGGTVLGGFLLSHVS